MGSHLLQRFAMGSAVPYSCVLLSLFTLQALCQTPPPCCQTKTVTNAPAGNENLNGEYVLKEAAGDKPHENCADGCVYMKDDEEYCFMNVPMDQAAEIECDATSGGPDGGEGTSPQVGPTGTGAGETAGPGAPTDGPGTEAPSGGPGAVTGASTGGPGAGTGASTGGPGEGTGASTGGPGAGTGATTGGAPAGTGVAGATTAQGAGATTIGDPSATGKAAQEAKEKATQEKEEAEATVEAAQKTSETAENVGKKIDDVIDAASASSATTKTGRVRRQATTGIPTFTTPSDCASFQSMVKEMNDQIALKTVAGLQTATNIGTALVSVVASAISCTADDVAALTSVKAEVEASVEVVATVIVVQQNVIKDAIDKINAAIETIKNVNEILISQGQTAFADPGTTLAPVTAPALPTQGPTEAPGAEETTPVGGQGTQGAGETTPGAGPEVATTAGGPEAATTAGGPGETTSGEGESSPPMMSTANPSRREFFGKRSRGSIL